MSGEKTNVHQPMMTAETRGIGMDDSLGRRKVKRMSYERGYGCIREVGRDVCSDRCPFQDLYPLCAT